MTRLVGLQDISPTSFIAGKHLSGKVISIKSYDKATKLAAITLESLSASSSIAPVNGGIVTVEIELKGNWAEGAMETFSVGLVVIVSSEFVRVVKRKPSRAGKEEESIWRIQFGDGIKGFTAERAEDRTPFQWINSEAARESLPSDSQGATKLTSLVHRVAGHPRVATVQRPSTRTSTATTTQESSLDDDLTRFGTLQEVTNGSPKVVTVAGGGKRVRIETQDVAEGGGEPRKKQKSEEREQVEEDIVEKVLGDAERDAQRKLEKVMKQTSPTGWPRELSVTAVSSAGVSLFLHPFPLVFSSR